MDKILETIVCPACHGQLVLEQTPVEQALVEQTLVEQTPVEQALVRCVACRRSYPIEDGIPVLLIARGRRESDQALSDGSTGK